MDDARVISRAGQYENTPWRCRKLISLTLGHDQTKARNGDGHSMRSRIHTATLPHPEAAVLQSSSRFPLKGYLFFKVASSFRAFAHRCISQSAIFPCFVALVQGTRNLVPGRPYSPWPSFVTCIFEALTSLSLGVADYVRRSSSTNTHPLKQLIAAQPGARNRPFLAGASDPSPFK